MKFVITDLEIRYEEFQKKMFLLGPKLPPVFNRYYTSPRWLSSRAFASCTGDRGLIPTDLSQ